MCCIVHVSRVRGPLQICRPCRLGVCRSFQQQDVVRTAQLMGSLKLTYFFDKDVDLLTGFSRTVRAGYVFGFPGDGLDDSKAQGKAAYRELCTGARTRVQSAGDTSSDGTLCTTM